MTARPAIAPAEAPKDAPAAAFTISPEWKANTYASERPTPQRTSCSVISEIAVGFIFCRPLKNPRKEENSGTKKSAGAIALTASADLGLPTARAIISAPKKQTRKQTVPTPRSSSVAT